MNKKLVLMGLMVGVVVLSGCKKKQAETTPTPKARKTDVNLNQEPSATRPFVLLTPRADGRAITLSINEMKKKASELEYEIEYNSGSLVQGAFGEIPLGTLPATKEILLGSCSSGGKCTYNTDVTGGTLTLRFGNPDFSLKQEWSHTEVKTGITTASSRDARFVMDWGKAKTTAKNIIVYNTPGYPGTLPGDIANGPYAVTTNGTFTGKVTVTVRLPSDVASAALYGWDGSAWKEVTSKVTDKSLSATTDPMLVFVTVKK